MTKQDGSLKSYDECLQDCKDLIKNKSDAYVSSVYISFQYDTGYYRYKISVLDSERKFLKVIHISSDSFEDEKSALDAGDEFVNSLIKGI
jgi:hypothetical protein